MKLRSLSSLALCLLTVWPAMAGSPNQLGRFVVVGDSLTAGFQNFSLFTSPKGGQEYGYAQQVAQQAGTDLRNPTVLYPGIPPTLTIDSAGNILHAPGLGFRLNPLAQTFNISVPSYTVADAVKNTIVYSQVLTNPTDVLALTVYGASLCGVRGFSLSSVTVSSIDCAVQLQPDTVLVSLGSNDALQALTFGALPTKEIDFESSYVKITNALKRTGAKVVLANVPDVTATPYLWTRASFTARCKKAPAIPGEYFVVNLVDPTQASGDICTNYIPRPPELINAAQAAVTGYNNFIASEAGRIHAALLDINDLFNGVAKTGVLIPGRPTPLTTAFLGGLFSLDGLHPTNTGYAVIANRTIETMNRAWPLNIPSIALDKIANNDPLVPK